MVHLRDGRLRQGFSIGDSNAQQAVSAGMSFEGPAAAARGASEEVQFEEVAGPIRRSSQSVSSCRPSREDDDSAEARFEEADEGEELDSQRVVGQEAAGGSGVVEAGATGGIAMGEVGGFECTGG